MFRLFSARVFSLATDHPLFYYYPLVSRWSPAAISDRAAGPGMMWYGWIAIAAIPAVLLAALVPNRVGQRIPGTLFWVLPPAMFLIAWYHERVWFQ